jgi:hypothetical protein
MIFSPTITTTTPPVTVSMTGITYAEFIQSLGTFQYRVLQFYAYSDDINQLLQPINYNEYQATGNRRIVFVNPEIDPFQSQKSLYKDVKGAGIVLNGQSNVSVNLLPNVLIKLQLFCDRVRITDMMDSKVPDNFKSLIEGEVVRDAFFGDYKDLLL